jgi:hypothetical protein
MTNVMAGWRMLREGGADTQVTDRLQVAVHSIEDRVHDSRTAQATYAFVVA